jgi:hypothetical protein
VDPDDETLVKQFLENGRIEDFEHLVRRHQQQVFRLAVSVLGPGRETDAEDVTQEVFLLVYHKLGRLGRSRTAVSRRVPSCHRRSAEIAARTETPRAGPAGALRRRRPPQPVRSVWTGSGDSAHRDASALLADRTVMEVAELGNTRPGTVKSAVPGPRAAGALPGVEGNRPVNVNVTVVAPVRRARRIPCTLQVRRVPEARGDQAEVVRALRGPETVLSASFGTPLDGVFEGPALRPAASDSRRPWLGRGVSLVPRWSMRLYWAGAGIAAASILARVAPVDPVRGEVLTIVGLLVTFGLQRAIGPWTLRRIMGASLRFR